MEDKRSNRLSLELVHDAPPLRIRYRPGSGDRLVLAFSGVGRSTGLDSEPALEFFRSASGGGENHVLHITDQSRSWLNAAGMVEAIADTVRRMQLRTGARRIAALGNSMGGTMALLIARFLPVDRVIAFTPQYSVQPAIVPEEAKWKRLRRMIAHYRFPAVDKIAPTGQQFVLHGDSNDELIHALRFPVVANLDHFIFPGHSHELGEDLKASGATARLVGLGLAGTAAEFAAAARAEGAVSRAEFERARPAGLVSANDLMQGARR
ncbi:MAG: hypothetical protein U1E48_15510 [Paracoccaceae bacterium]